MDNQSAFESFMHPLTSGNSVCSQAPSIAVVIVWGRCRQFSRGMELGAKSRLCRRPLERESQMTASVDSSGSFANADKPRFLIDFSMELCRSIHLSGKSQEASRQMAVSAARPRPQLAAKRRRATVELARREVN